MIASERLTKILQTLRCATYLMPSGEIGGRLATVERATAGGTQRRGERRQTRTVSSVRVSGIQYDTNSRAIFLPDGVRGHAGGDDDDRQQPDRVPIAIV
jgi:hypothetical protein